MSDTKINTTAKATVFTDLFSFPEYLFQLYQALHPEDRTAAIDDLTLVTLQPILARDYYNDLGFIVGNRLMVLVEAQSTWTVNIIPRSILYLSKTWIKYCAETRQNIYGTKRLELPDPELYVVYSGDKAIGKEIISLRDEFFGGRKVAIDAEVRVLTETGQHDIISQYITWCQVFDRQRKLYPYDGDRVVTETIRICKERDILKEYLTKREKEATKIMFALFNEEQIQQMTIEAERKDAEARGMAKGKAEGQVSSIRGIMKNLGWPAEKAMQAVGIPEADYPKYMKLLAT